MAADGSIIIDTRIDTRGFTKGVSSLESSSDRVGQKLTTEFKKLGTVVAAAFSVQQVIQFGVASSKAARQLSDALTGLQSIVEGQGRSFSEANQFIQEYTKDGLIPATNAITAYKNLASRGYDDSQIRQVMIALKDASAFGRQASYSMGEAVQGATEGLKNENSILVDNAGVTKNVAKMWDEYAASIGTTTNNLTQQQKIQAEVAGIMEETKFQTGDAAKVAGTLSGQLQQLSFNFNNLKVSVGNMVNPLVQKVLPTINLVLNAFTKLANAAAMVMSLLFGKVASSGNGLAEQNAAIAQTAEAGAAAEEKLAEATSSAAKAAKKSQASFDELQILQTGTAGGGGGSGGASGGGAAGTLGQAVNAITAETVVEDTISPQIEAIAAKIQELIAPLKDINFKPMQNSLKKLGTSFRSFGNTVGKALEWVWENILVPLSEWTIEEAAPEAVELLAAALETVSSVADPVIDGLDEITDDLAPLVNFIKRNVIIELDKWKTRFELVAKTMKDKSPEITQIISNLGTIFSKCWSIIGPVLTKLQDGLEKTNRYISEEFAIGIALVIDVLAGLTEFVVDVFNGDWDEAWADIVGIFDDTKTAIEKTAIALEKATGIQFTKILNNAKTKFTATKNAILNTWEEIEENGLWATIESKLNSSWESIRTKAKSKFGSVKDEITGAWKDVLDYFKNNDIDLKVIGTNITNAFKDALNKLIMRLNAAIGTPLRNLNSSILKLRKFEIFGAKPFASVPLITVPKIPYLAKGAVIPPGNPYLAVVGDQKRGTNIEAPLSTIEQAVANVLSSQNQNININFVGELAALARVLKPEIDKENVRVGTSLAKGVT